MPNPRSYYPPQFVREIRLGLVVHGGISLAIYIHGVCQEFYHAVRGRGIYKLVKALTDADLVIDAISGSSAGGINGILLSYAIANSTDRKLVNFNGFASIWCNSGDLLKLLHKPHILESTAARSSLGKDVFYQRELISILTRGVEEKLPRSPQEWYSPCRELDLAIVGTDYLGRIDAQTVGGSTSTAKQLRQRQLEETGVKLNAKNHHVLFHLKHRQGRKEPFNPNYSDENSPRTAADTYQALAKLCRITAGIPIFFPLVEVDLQDEQNLVDRQLVMWGKLSQNYVPDIYQDRNYKLYFLDGGLLDNAPLTCIMKETYYRLSNRSGYRKLFYIDPDAHADSVHKQTQNDLNLLLNRSKDRRKQMLQSAVFSGPIYQSISNDLRTIQEHNYKVNRYQILLELAESAIDSQTILASADRTESRMYLRGRLFDFRDRNLPLLLQSNLGSENISYSVILDKIDRSSSKQHHNSNDEVHYHKLLDRFESQTTDLDVEYSIRQHFYLIDRIADLLNTDLDFNTHRQLQHLSGQLGCNIKLLEVVRASLELLFSDRSIGNHFYYLVNQESSDRRIQPLIYELIFRLHRFLLDDTRFSPFIPPYGSSANLETIQIYFWVDLPKLAAQNHGDRWLSQTRISSIFAQLKQRIGELQHSTELHKLIWGDKQLEYDRDRNQSFPSILKQISLATEVLIEKSVNQYSAKLLKQWRTFSSVDCETYPFEYLTNLTEKELIEPIGISPNNAQVGIGKGKNIQDKLAGNKLYNTGGTFKKSWRVNDLIWGRLDGLNRIVEGIVTPESVTAFSELVERESTRNNCSHQEYLDWLIDESLPRISGIDRQKIIRHLERLAQPKLQIDRAELHRILADIILVGQREILTNDNHSIVEGVNEQSSWWRFPEKSQLFTTNWTFNPNYRPLSAPVTNPNTIGRITRQSLANLAAQNQYFFRHQYRVGVDKLSGTIPLVSFISICNKIILVLRHLLLTLFGLSRRRTMRHPIYHWLDGNLQSLYWWLQGGSIKLGAFHRRPRIILLQVSIGIIGSGIVFIASKTSPIWLLLFFPCLMLGWFLQTMRLKRLAPVKNNRFLPQSTRDL
jgi:patatin-related protein